MYVSEALQRAYRQLPVFKKDERIYPLLESFPQQYLGKDYAGVSTNKKGRRVDINDIDKVRNSFNAARVPMRNFVLLTRI